MAEPFQSSVSLIAALAYSPGAWWRSRWRADAEFHVLKRLRANGRAARVATMNTPRLMVTKRVRLDSHHHASLTNHTLSDAQGVRNFPPFVELVIAAYPGETSCYLFHICAHGQMADTWHEVIEDALHQAEWEFGVKPEEWVEPSSPEEL
jgi:hypothetical protein